MAPDASAWEDHRLLTRASLQAYENWEPAPYEPLEKALPSLSVGGQAPADRAAFIQALQIQPQKINWEWQPLNGAAATGLEVMVQAVREPDEGMDQNLNLSPDQKYMGGYSGLPSQAIRHMYYRAWNPFAPLLTFHFPLHEMGMAPDRAELFFNLAKQARQGGHVFWAYRLLGWGLHYVQDIGQPYHASQFANIKLLPLKILFSVGWEAFVAEATRVVSNFHLVFEEYIDFALRPDRDSPLANSFKVPQSNESFKSVLEQRSDLSIKEGVQQLAIASSELAPDLASAENDLMGKQLMDPALDVGKTGFRGPDGRPKVDLAAVEADEKLSLPRKAMTDNTFRALSNTGLATRWYVDRFKSVTADPAR